MAIQTDKAVAAVFYNGTSIPIAMPDTQSKTVTPTASGITVTPDTGKLLERVVVNGDVNLVPENILSGKSIFGVQGTASAGYRHGTSTVSASSSTTTLSFSGLLGKPVFVSCIFKGEFDGNTPSSGDEGYGVAITATLNGSTYTCSIVRMFWDGSAWAFMIGVYGETSDISASYSGGKLTFSTSMGKFLGASGVSYTLDYFY